VISRSETGENILSKAVSDGQIALTLTQKEKIIRSQRRSLYRKRYVIRAYMNITKLFGGSVPTYTGQFDSRSLTWREYREAVVLIFFRFLSEQPIFQKILALGGRLFLSYMAQRRKATGKMVLK
jgi:hypothetical protein